MRKAEGLTLQQWKVIKAMRAGSTLEVGEDGKVLFDGEPMRRWKVLLDGLLEEGCVKPSEPGSRSYTLTHKGKTCPAFRGQPRLHKRTMPSFSLGAPGEAQRRVQALNDIANDLGISDDPAKGRSRLMQMIADRELIVVRPG